MNEDNEVNIDSLIVGQMAKAEKMIAKYTDKDWLAKRDAKRMNNGRKQLQLDLVMSE